MASLIRTILTGLSVSLLFLQAQLNFLHLEYMWLTIDTVGSVMNDTSLDASVYPAIQSPNSWGFPWGFPWGNLT